MKLPLLGDLELLREVASTCTGCRLHETRTHAAFARGDPRSPLHLIGEGPGEVEDRTSVPFVGPSGVLLDEMLAQANIDPKRVYIHNAVCCRPPKNRPPTQDEIEACWGILGMKLAFTDPAVIVLLGRTALTAFGLDGDAPMGKFTSLSAVTIMPTFHPAYVLRMPDKRDMVVEHLDRAAGVAGRQVRRKP